MDDASFRAIYMNEPIEREGLLYKPEDFERAYELPEGEPDAILAVCDTAEGGGDRTAMPVCYVYGDKHYLWDAVSINALPEVTQPLCASVLLNNKVENVQFESNSAGARFADCVRDIVKQKGGNTHISKKFTSTNKETKIITESNWIKEHIVLKDPSVIEKKSMYEQFLNNAFTYTLMGKNKHDDEVDALAEYSRFYRSFIGSKVTLIDRKMLGW